MTRGTICLITNDKLYKSVEFNGDMYPEGYGDEVIDGLQDVEDELGFIEFVHKFNKKNHGYKCGLIKLHYRPEIDVRFDFNIDYYKLDQECPWFSDWLFFKNISDKTIEFKLSHEQKGLRYLLEPGMTVRFCFGTIGDEDIETYCIADI